MWFIAPPTAEAPAPPDDDCDEGSGENWLFEVAELLKPG